MSKSAATQNKPEVTLEQFVKVNVTLAKEGKGIKEIAEALGMERDYVSQRRTQLRNKGIPLPTLNKGGGGRNRIDVDSAQALIAQLTGQDLKEVKKQGQDLVAAAKDRETESDE